MQKKAYDLAIGLGMACSCSQTLREAGLQYMSFPYDWVTLIANTESAYDGDLPRRASELADGFSSWFSPDDFKYLSSSLANGKDSYVCERLGLIFQHDFYSGIPYNKSFPAVLAKYQRRINRLMSYLHGSKHILIVRIDRPDLPFSTSAKDLISAQKTLRAAFNDISFDVFNLAYQKGLSFQNRRIEAVAPGITRVSFDYKDQTPGCAAYAVNTTLTAAYFRSLFAVRDYRSPEDKKNFDRERRLNRYRKAGARNWLDYQFKRLSKLLSGHKKQP